MVSLATELVACSGSTSHPTPAGVKTGPGFDGKQITLGVIAPLTGPTAQLAAPVLAGNQLYWDELNAKGGVAGRYPVRLQRADSQYFESVAALRYDEIESGVVMLNQIFDSKATTAILPRLRMQGVVAATATDDPEWVAEPNLLPTGAPAEIRTINAISYWVDHGGRGRRLCALHQDDTYGPVGFDGVTYAVAQLHLELAAAPTFRPLEGDLSRQLDVLRQANCDAVFFNGNFLQATDVARRAQAAGFSPQWIASAQSSSASLLAQTDLQEYLRAHWWTVGNGPTPGDRSIPGMRRLVDAQRRYGSPQPVDVSVVAGYVESWAVDQVLERAVARHDLSRAGIIQAMRTVGTLRFDGLYPDYRVGAGAANRRPPRASTVFAVDPSVPGELKALAADATSAAATRFSLPT